ncbi:hypothetical protein L1085_008695 [Streptomyces sp. MSC1_001]
MKRNRRPTPALVLLGAQTAVWPGTDLIRGSVPAGSVLLVTVLVTGTVTAALCLPFETGDRPRPTVAVCALGAGSLPTGATAALGTAGVALALFTVADERDAFTTVPCVTAFGSWQALYGLTRHGFSDRDGLDVVLTVALYATAYAAGILVRRAGPARRATEQVLKRAGHERHRLPAIERQRWGKPDTSP